jgi:uncharacterized protein (DUF169 family)
MTTGSLLEQHALLGDELERRLRMATAPVAIRFVRDGEEAPSGLLRRFRKLTFCQTVAAASSGGYGFLVTRELLSCPNARIAFGFDDIDGETDALQKAAKSHVGKYAHNLDTAVELVKAKPRIPLGTVEAVAVAPLAKTNFVPDALILTLLPWQAYHAINGYLFATGQSSVPLEAGTNSLACAYVAVRSGFEQRLNLVTACTGGRAYAGFQTSDVILGVPWKDAEALRQGLVERAKENPYPGMILMPTPAPLPVKHILKPSE